MPFRFASCSLDPERHEFRRAEELVRLEPQVFDLLFALVQSHGDLVSRERLIETVWRGVNVSDATISARINAARAAVGDTGKDQRIIRTVPRRGYQLAVPVEADEGPAPDDGATAPEERQVVRFTHSADGLRVAPVPPAADGVVLLVLPGDLAGVPRRSEPEEHQDSSDNDRKHGDHTLGNLSHPT